MNKRYHSKEKCLDKWRLAKHNWIDDTEVIERTEIMSCSLYAYRPNVCEGRACVGDCDLCDIPESDEYLDDVEDEEQEIIDQRKGFE